MSVSVIREQADMNIDLIFILVSLINFDLPKESTTKLRARFGGLFFLRFFLCF